MGVVRVGEEHNAAGLPVINVPAHSRRVGLDAL